MTGPLVLGLHPGRGWRSAEGRRRRLAVLCAVQLAGWPLLALAPGGDVAVAGLAVLLGPLAFSSAARVLRPHPHGAAGERVLRHWLSAASTALGGATITLLVTDRGEDIVLLLALPAALGLLVTVPWGVMALVARALSTPVPERLRAQPLPVPQR